MYLSLFLSENMFGHVSCYFFLKNGAKECFFFFLSSSSVVPCSEAKSDLDRPFVDRAFRTRTNRV
jgi:hypothetical protein